MAIEFKVPSLAEGVESADVAQIHVSEGDTIEADQAVMELETDKAVADLPCPHAGKIVKIHVSSGDTVDVGQTVLTIEEADSSQSEEGASDQQADEDKPSKDEKPADDEQPDEEQQGDDEPESDEEQQADEEQQTDNEQQADDEKQAVHEQPSDDEQKVDDVQEPDQEEQADEKPSAGHSHDAPLPAGPATRRLARKLHVELDEVEGSGRRGRIRPEDVVHAVEEQRTHLTPASPSRELPDFSRFGPVEEQPLNKIARTAINRLSMSWSTIPQVTQHDLADITELEHARQEDRDRQGHAGQKITLTAFLLKAVAGMLREYPRLNSSLNEDLDTLIVKRYYHLGVAVDTEHGLLVPVIRDVDRKSIIQLADELRELAEAARSRELKREQMEGATFTVSNQGSIGGTSFTPLVVSPQVAILGISQARSELRIMDGKPRERLILPLSLSYDHRVINGATAARFLSHLADELSSCFELLIRT
jgi:pyruvate dehydrogenase E2 component (dihydrolipoamide acetyltransferase)